MFHRDFVAEEVRFNSGLAKLKKKVVFAHIHVKELLMIVSTMFC